MYQSGPKSPIPLPPSKPLGIWLLFNNFGEIPWYVDSLDAQMHTGNRFKKSQILKPTKCVKPFIQM